MYNPNQFEEAAFEIYLQGMKDYKTVCWNLAMNVCDDCDEIGELLDDAQKEFEQMIDKK